MTRDAAFKQIGRLRDNQEELVKTLQMLFDLLEDYAPSWYSEEHHNVVSAALARGRELLKLIRAA